MTFATIAVIFAGAFAGGFVSGLAGFGLALIALGVWINVIDPVPAVMAVLACSVSAQASTIRTVWHAIEPRRVLPFILPGLAGIPIGVMLLGSIPVATFKLLLGWLLVLFGVGLIVLRKPIGLTWGGRIADGVMGFLGGVMGGLAGLSGPLPTLWAVLRGWGKDEKRSVFQAYNVSILGASLVVGILTGKFGLEALKVFAVALPGALAGAWIGVRAYGRLSDRRFTDVILALMAVSGVVLLWNGR